MAITPYTAQCPNCNADIDLTQKEMDMGGGDIICGNCNNQFHAPNYLLKGFYSASNERNDTTVDADEVMGNSDFETISYSAYRRKKFFRNLLSAAFNLLLLSVLIFQLLWVNFDRWAVKENLRPVYGFLCSIEQLKCVLPNFVEPTDIKIEKFEANLRNGKEYVLQATLTNYGSTYKEFPWLEVVFSDANNYPVASGRFSPYQYLSSDEASDLMPPGKPFRLVLEIQRPSMKVAKYEMNIVGAN